MDKSLRCTICSWRGTWAEAAAVHVQPAPLPPALEEIQRTYEEKQLEAQQLGGERIPHCPVCGHHTLPTKLHRSNAAA
jgi:hypothetical protein